MAKSTKFQNTLLEIGQRIMSTLDLDKLLCQILTNAKTLIDVERISIALTEDGHLIRASFEGLTPKIETTPSEVAFPFKKGSGALVWQTGKSVAFTDYWHDPRIEHAPKIIQQRSLRAVLAVPVLLGEEIVAVMWFSKNQVYQWQPEDLEGAEQLAALASLAIHNARLFGQREKLNRELTARNLELEALQEFNKKMRGPIELKSTANRAVALAIEVVGAEAGILLVQNNTNPLELEGVAYSGPELNEVPPWLVNLKYGEGLAGKVAKNGQTWVIKDFTEFLRGKPGFNLASNNNWQTAMFVPLITGEKVVGVLVLISTQIGKFSKEEIRFAETMCGQIATAIQHVSQIELYREREQLEAALTLARTAAHDLNQPLTLLQVELDFVREFGETPDPETLVRMYQSVLEMAELLNGYQKIVRFNTFEMVPGIQVLQRD